MAEYTIQAVAKEVRDYDTKYGAMKSYKVKFPHEADPVEINQKATTPAPKAGDVLNGTIEDGQYGKKFKKDFGGAGGGKSGASKPSFDSFTMYLSYAKDIATACIDAGKFNAKLYAEALEAVLAGGNQLYAGRPDAQPDPNLTPTRNEPMPTEPEGDDDVEWDVPNE